MKFYYLANARLPTEKAHGIQIAKMCEALVDAGVTVELVVPKRLNPIKTTVHEYYGVRENFTIKKLWCFDLISIAPALGPLAYWVEAISFAFSVSLYIRSLATNPSSASPTRGGVYLTPPLEGEEEGVVYTRELANLLFLPKRRRVVYEAHNLPRRASWLFWKLLAKVDKFVVITNGLKEDLIQLDIPSEKILVAPDGVDRKHFETILGKETMRQRIGLPQNKKIILYTGHLYPRKGVYTLLEAAKKFDDSYLFVFVGGTQEDQRRFGSKVVEMSQKNVELVSHQPHRNIPAYLRAADVLVIPNSAKWRVNAKYTSPLKLFEYMMAGRPIVASDLPSVREVLNDEMAELVAPDDSAQLAAGIINALTQEELSRKRVWNAHEKVLDYTWHKRAQKILEYLKL